MTVHNLHFYLSLMRDMREAIEAGRFGAWAGEYMSRRRAAPETGT
jgi:queuine tRNA-ribosyltransferase